MGDEKYMSIIYQSNELIFKPIDFLNHADFCIQFRADSFLVSFGTTEPFYEEDANGSKYIEWLKNKIGPTYSAFHIWYQDQLIGQMELGRRKTDDEFGYVNLYYLIPEFRGKGFSSDLDNFATFYLRSLKFQKARLCVSPSNLRAINFYKNHGWHDLGLRVEADRTGKGLKFPVNYMEKAL